LRSIPNRSFRNDPPELQHWLILAIQGDADAGTRLFATFREPLKELVARQLDPRLKSRVDPSDIIQEAFLVAARELQIFASSSETPFSLWLYRLVRSRMVEAYRFHAKRQRRSVFKERTAPSHSTTDWLKPIVESIADPSSGPLSKIAQSEQILHLNAMIERLRPENRELLKLRYEDGLTIPEISIVLGIREPAAKMRHLRLLESLRKMLRDHGHSSP
jgi:RNA polymerase sigma-70 factor (ECF subfamily)